MYREPVSHVLCGFCCDDSGFDKSQFVVYRFSLPLYVPTTHVHFLFGQRLKDDAGCDIWWNVGDPDIAAKLLACIQSQGIPSLSKTETPTQLKDFAEQLPSTDEPYKWETVAYSAIMVGDYEEARLAFGRLANAVDISVSWQVEMLARSHRLEQTLARDPQQAKQLLQDWEHFSASQLGIL